MFKNQQGVTLIELMIVIIVIGIISAVFVLNIKGDKYGEVRATTEKLLSDIKYARNLATSRAVYNFASGEAYPKNGYGVYFNITNPDGFARYFIFADQGAVGYAASSGDVIIGSEVVIADRQIDLLQSSDESIGVFYVSFLTENQISTNIVPDSLSRYGIKIEYDAGEGKYGYRGTIRLGEDSDDDYKLANVGLYFAEFYHPAPPPPARTKDPVEIFLLD